MEWLDILQRIEAGEDARTEFKRGLGDFAAVGKTICAFANGDGGLLVLGVDDDGRIVGVPEDSEMGAGTTDELPAQRLRTAGHRRMQPAPCGRRVGSLGRGRPPPARI